MKIDGKITSFAVKSEDTPTTKLLTERNERLSGATYKIKPGNSDHAMYITINDKDGRPYELFINSKCPDSIAWLLTATRLISAVMRVSPDIQFVIDELKNVQDPRGAYFYKGLGHIPSVQAHIGLILEKHIDRT